MIRAGIRRPRRSAEQEQTGSDPAEHPEEPRQGQARTGLAPDDVPDQPDAREREVWGGD